MKMRKFLMSLLAVALASILVTSLSQIRAAFFDVVEVSPNKMAAGVRGRPYVEVLSPNGGERWCVGEEQIVQWKAVDPDGLRLQVTLLVSPDGLQWFPIVEQAENTGFYQWTPDLSPGKYLLKVVAVAPRDPWQVTGEDTSNRFWKLKRCFVPTPTVTSPPGP